MANQHILVCWNFNRGVAICPIFTAGTFPLLVVRTRLKEEQLRFPEELNTFFASEVIDELVFFNRSVGALNTFAGAMRQ